MQNIQPFDRPVLPESINKQTKIAINSTSGIFMVELNSIIFLQSDGPYTTIYSSAGENIVSSKNLMVYDNLLAPFGFFRVHRSYLISISKIVQYVRSDGGYVIMSNGARVDVSAKRREELLAKLSAEVLFL
jgi:two-component system LytT family response regulator